jgi:transcriptional regulator with XRE-family HTH domain
MSDQDDLEQSHAELLRVESERHNWTDFGRWLQAARVERGYTQAFVARQAGIGAQTLVSLEHGGFRREADGPWITPNPKDETLVALARVLGVDAEEMFAVVGRYDERQRTQASLRRASGKRSGRDRMDELERRVAELEETVRELGGDTQGQPARRRRRAP